MQADTYAKRWTWICMVNYLHLFEYSYYTYDLSARNSFAEISMFSSFLLMIWLNFKLMNGIIGLPLDANDPLQQPIPL